MPFFHHAFCSCRGLVGVRSKRPEDIFEFWLVRFIPSGEIDIIPSTSVLINQLLLYIVYGNLRLCFLLQDSWRTGYTWCMFPCSFRNETDRQRQVLSKSKPKTTNDWVLHRVNFVYGASKSDAIPSSSSFALICYIILI